MITYINFLFYIKRKFSNCHIEIIISSKMHGFYANIYREIVRKRKFQTDRGKESQSRGRKKKEKSWRLGERFPRALRACAIQFIWTGDPEVGRHGSTLVLRRVSAVCELLVARSRPQRRGALRRASLAATPRSIDRSLDQCRFDRVVVHPIFREESNYSRKFSSIRVSKVMWDRI